MNENEFTEAINTNVVEEEETEVVEAEAVETLPSTSASNVPAKRGKLSLKYRTIAEYAARGYPVDFIAKQLNLKESTIYRILEENVSVWEEINKIISNMFAEGDRILAGLRKKALTKLDEHLEHPNAEIRDKAIEKILKCYDYNKGEGPQTAILNFYGQQPGGGGGKSPLGIESIDDIILRKRKERGLKD